MVISIYVFKQSQLSVIPGEKLHYPGFCRDFFTNLKIGPKNKTKPSSDLLLAFSNALTTNQICNVVIHLIAGWLAYNA